MKFGGILLKVGSIYMLVSPPASTSSSDPNPGDINTYHNGIVQTLGIQLCINWLECQVVIEQIYVFNLLSDLAALTVVRLSSQWATLPTTEVS